MFKQLFSKLVGDPNKKIIDNLRPFIAQVNALEPAMQQLSNDGLREKTEELRRRHLEQEESLDNLMAEAFALVREASVRTTGLRHYDVQLMGGALLHGGDVVEMRTGEGKTLVGTLPLFLNAITGRGVHLVTINDYLARRDGGWMGKIFDVLGLTVGCVGPLQFSALYDPDYVNPGAELEDERLVHWRPCTRKQAYMADITYGISSEFGFDYLRDHMVTTKDRLVQRELVYAIIDEVDNVLIDEARTPLIISGPAPRSGKEYARFADYVRGLKRNTAEEDEEPNGHYTLDEKSRSISLTESGIAEIEKRIPEIDIEAGDNLYDPRFNHLTYYLDNALKAQYMFKRDVEYVVQDGQVVIIDDFTGRLMPGRRYSEGLHEAIEAKEGVQIKRETVTVATITLQNYFRLYEKLAGMTGTAVTDAEEFDKIYKLGVTPLPTHVQYLVDSGKSGLAERREKVESSEQVKYVDAATNEPRYFKRIDFKDQIFGNEAAKDRAIINEIKRYSQAGRPILVGTTSVEHSETIHKLLDKERIPHTVLNAKIHQSEALVVAQAGRKGFVTISTNMAGRGTDILLGGNPEGMAAEMVEDELFKRPLLAQLAYKLLDEGEAVALEMAQKHPKLQQDLVVWLQEVKQEMDEALIEIERSQLIGFLSQKLRTTYQVEYDVALKTLRLINSGFLAEARDYLEEQNVDVAMVEDATRLSNLYGRYQRDHKDTNATAQFLAEVVFDQHYIARSAIIRAVMAGDKAEAQRVLTAVRGMPANLISKIEALKKQAEQERQEVWRLGGLHVVGSERHESRRIDNQLRGRAARQGDPGSSRFFLSVEDELMRRFGGERLKSWMSKGFLANIPEDTPLEFSVLDKMIENAQQRVEGFNFDMRKNIVEYDDVMNRQRLAIYSERTAILMERNVDYDAKVNDAFAKAISELVDNYVANYEAFCRREIEQVISNFSTDATDDVNITAVMSRLRGLLPGIINIEKEDLAKLKGSKLVDRLMELAYDNEDNGHNLYQLFLAMSRFLPLFSPAPNLGELASRKTGHLQIRDTIRRNYLTHIEQFFNEFVTEQVELEASERNRIWQTAVGEIDTAFDNFSVDGLSIKNAATRQLRFKQSMDQALQNMLLGTIKAMEPAQLESALGNYVHQQQDKWRQHIGPQEYRNYQRTLLLSAIDREWRDYLTAADDLRREIGLEALGQRDPKVQYKIRSAEMFQDMRNNIDKDIADRFFREISQHQAFVQQQEAEQQYQLQAREAGFSAVKRDGGKGVELRRDVPKVGRNDLCPCGSGKKYKNCHERQDKSKANLAAQTGQATAVSANKSKSRR